MDKHDFAVMLYKTHSLMELLEVAEKYPEEFEEFKMEAEKGDGSVLLAAFDVIDEIGPDYLGHWCAEMQLELSNIASFAKENPEVLNNCESEGDLIRTWWKQVDI